MFMASMMGLMGLCRTAANASDYWTTNALSYSSFGETNASPFHHLWRCILHRCYPRVDASTIGLNITILDFRSPSG
jgi:hypothetical protein